MQIKIKIFSFVENFYGIFYLLIIKYLFNTNKYLKLLRTICAPLNFLNFVLIFLFQCVQSLSFENFGHTRLFKMKF